MLNFVTDTGPNVTDQSSWSFVTALVQCRNSPGQRVIRCRGLSLLPNTNISRQIGRRPEQVLLFLRGLLHKFDNRQCKVSPRR